MNPYAIVVGLLALAVAFGSVRALWRQWRLPTTERPRAWRVAVLLLAQVASAALLYFTLFPPPQPRETGTLVVLTARASEVTREGVPGERVVALPEAGTGTDIRPGAERFPDLAGALRRYPATRHIRVVGVGLVARDREAARGRSIEFRPAPLPPGLAELQAPARVPAGRRFTVTGRAMQLPEATAELLDPAGRRVDRVAPDDERRFELHASTRNAGLVSYRIQLRDARGEVIADATVPLEVTPARELQVRVLAGAPNPELKFLRRWALDAGLELDTRISLGAGMQIGSAPTGFDAAALDELDLLVLDDRSWRALGSGQRAALDGAIERGLGLLLRLSGPLTGADRQRLQAAYGITAATGGTARQTRLGGDLVAAGDAADALPTITDSALRFTTADAITLLADATGTPLTIWRAHGRGRIGVTTLSDSYRLVLAGHDDLHGDVWSEAFTTLARSQAATGPRIAIDAAAPHQRSVICGIGDGAKILSPDGTSVTLHVDPASGASRCAGFWATTAGWHQLRDGKRSQLMHVRDITEAPGLAAESLHAATRALVAGELPGDDTASDSGPPTRPGPRWPWFAAWLLLGVATWWLERSRVGLQHGTGASADGLDPDDPSRNHS
ncbi:carboxypeptidase regulatory-like domain-containing protein [Novilysobacter erysipheiresistens]|uniref:Carboxypeptidase regulatory-like domain-containing protein n=1 Tax=Novilysobacter erysipheiresistens TaxID=1749332 RepID=A0ABU7YWG2_9GAMM